LFSVLQAVVVQGHEPLTASTLSAAQPQEQKEMLGERLFPLIHVMHHKLAGKITGMLLEKDNAEVLHMLENPEALKAKVEEAVAVLEAYKAKVTSGAAPSVATPAPASSDAGTLAADAPVPASSDAGTLAADAPASSDAGTPATAAPAPASSDAGTPAAAAPATAVAAKE
jgi:hypothetical protein